MNKNLQNRLSNLEELIKIQRDCQTDDPNAQGYMHGMLNGMILAHSVFSDQRPIYHKIKRAKKSRNRVRRTK